MNTYQLLELILEELADGRQEGESIADYKKRKADELEKHFANKEEEAKTKARAYKHQYKKEKKEWKNNPQIGAEKALDTADKALNSMIKSSDARRKKWEVQGIKKKMSKNEALEIMEEIINEVSLKKWKEAAKNSIEGREKEAAKSLEATDKGWQEYEKEARKHPEDEPQLFKLAQANDAAAYKDKERAEHAAKVAYNAPDSKHSANKFLKAARNAEEFHMDKADYRKPAHKDEHYKKAMYARHQASMDPVKSRTDEAFSLIEAIINEVSVKRWKEAAKNSIEGREAESDKLNDIPIGAYLSGSVSPKHAEKALKAMDRESRARYLAKNLPDSDKSASKLKGVAKNSVEGRSKDSDNAVDKLVKAHKEYKEARDNAREKGEKQIADDIVDKANKAKKEYDKKLFKREDRARTLAGKELRRAKSMKEPALVKTTGAYHEKVWQDEALEIMEEILNTVSEDELHDQKAIRRNAEKNAKGHAYKAKQFERRSDRAIEQGKERKAEALYDKANAEWDKETAEQDRAAKAHHKVEELRYGKESINCALDLMEQIVDFADNLFELDLEQKQNISPNKVSRVKKDKNGEKVEVVSVADELFPYEGDAKQQFNQKVLAKINDMIEGTGSLEDLIQFVRKGVAMKKQAAHEGLNEEKNIFGKETGRGDLLNDVDDALGSPVKKKLADIKAKMTGCKETKVHEALDLMEEIINEVSITKWKETAARVLPKRQEEAKRADIEADKTDKLVRAAANDPKNQGADGRVDLNKYHADKRYQKSMNALTNAIRADHRVAHAREVANLPDSKKSAQKLRRAADNSFDKREQHWSDVESSGCGGEKWTKDVTRAEKRMDKAGNLARIDTIVHANGRKADRY